MGAFFAGGLIGLMVIVLVFVVSGLTYVVGRDVADGMADDRGLYYPERAVFVSRVAWGSVAALWSLFTVCGLIGLAVA